METQNKTKKEMIEFINSVNPFGANMNARNKEAITKLYELAIKVKSQQNNTQ